MFVYLKLNSMKKSNNVAQFIADSNEIKLFVIILHLLTVNKPKSFISSDSEMN